MDKMITLIVPVLDEYKMTKRFLHYVAKNVVIPSKIILIDDGSTEDIKSLLAVYPQLPITYIRHEETLGVNPSWNEAIEKVKTPLVCIMNNDVVFGPYFFKKMVLARKHEKWGIFCPDMIRKHKSIPAIDKETNDDEVKVIDHLRRKSGWAFTIRKEILDQILPIPSQFPMSNGDNYFWMCTRKLGYGIGQVVGARLYHYGSVTVKKHPYNTQTHDWQKFLRQVRSGVAKWKKPKQTKSSSKEGRKKSSLRHTT